MSLDQSFSADNFRKILDVENRKGVFLEGRFFCETEKVIELNKRYSIELRQKRKSRGTHAARIRSLKKGIKNLKRIKEAMLMQALQEVSTQVTKPNFHIQINQRSSGSGPPVYTVDDTASCYFTMKQLQKNISRLFQVKQANRFAIVSQVINSLENKLPKFVLRTDIQEFYERIPHKELLDLVHENNLLSPRSKK